MFSIRTSFLSNASKKTWRFSAVFMKNRLLSIHWAYFILPWSYEKSGLSFLRFVLINLLKLVPEGIWIAVFFLSVSGKIFLHNVLVIFCVVMWSTWGHVSEPSHRCEKTLARENATLEAAYVRLPHTGTNSHPICIFHGGQHIPLSLGLLCAVISTAWLLRSGHTQSFTVVSMLLGYLTSPLFSVWKSTVQ